MRSGGYWIVIDALLCSLGVLLIVATAVTSPMNSMVLLELVTSFVTILTLRVSSVVIAVTTTLVVSAAVEVLLVSATATPVVTATTLMIVVTTVVVVV